MIIMVVVTVCDLSYHLVAAPVNCINKAKKAVQVLNVSPPVTLTSTVCPSPLLIGVL